MRNSRTGLWSNNLADRRSRSDMTQSALAEKVGVVQTTIAAIEKGVISGRRYMDDIAKALRVDDPAEIFPYYIYYSFDQAADRAAVTPSLISRRVADGVIPHVVIGGVKLIPKEEFTVDIIKKLHRGPNIREFVFETLRAHGNGGMSSSDLLALIESDEDKERNARLTVELDRLLVEQERIRKDVRSATGSERANLRNRLARIRAKRNELLKERDRTKQTLQSILSRSAEFYSDKSVNPPRWRIAEDAFVS